MAYAIIGSLFVATLLTLLCLPALYVAWFRIKEPKERPVRAKAPAPAAALWPDMRPRVNDPRLYELEFIGGNDGKRAV